MSAEDLEKYETDMELSLYREYRDIVSQFSYVNVRRVGGRAVLVEQVREDVGVEGVTA